DTTVTLKSGYVSRSTLKTGTVIATSPMADKRTTNMCLGFAIHFLIIFSEELDLVHHRCTFSFACTLSYTYLQPEYRQAIAEYLYLYQFFSLNIYLYLSY